MSIILGQWEVGIGNPPKKDNATFKIDLLFQVLSEKMHWYGGVVFQNHMACKTTIS